MRRAIVLATTIAIAAVAFGSRTEIDLPFVGGEVDVVYASPPASRVCHLGIDRHRRDTARALNLSKRSDSS